MYMFKITNSTIISNNKYDHFNTSNKTELKYLIGKLIASSIKICYECHYFLRGSLQLSTLVTST